MDPIAGTNRTPTGDGAQGMMAPATREMPASALPDAPCPDLPWRAARLPASCGRLLARPRVPSGIAPGGPFGWLRQRW